MCNHLSDLETCHVRLPRSQPPVMQKNLNEANSCAHRSRVPPCTVCDILITGISSPRVTPSPHLPNSACRQSVTVSAIYPINEPAHTTALLVFPPHLRMSCSCSASDPQRCHCSRRRSLSLSLLQLCELSVNSPAAAAVQTPGEENDECGDQDKGQYDGVRGGHVVCHLGDVGCWGVGCC